MNRQRRKDIQRIIDVIEEAKALLNGVVEDADGVKGEEEEAYDMLPESLQGGEQGEKMQAAVSSLGEAHDALETLADDTLDEIISALQTAAE